MTRLESPEEARQRLEQQGLSERERAELWSRVTTSADPDEALRRRLRRWAIPLAINALATALLVGGYFALRSERETVTKPEVIDPCALDLSASALRLPAACGRREADVNGDGWHLEGGAEVARVAGGAHVARGRVQFRVRPRKVGDPPFVVQVSHAEVRVIGTVFVIDQREGTGSVSVSEGVIEVAFRDGSRQRVAAGESASWPRVAPAASAQPEPTSQARDAGVKRSDSRTQATPDLDAVTERLLVLRSQKRYGEAVALLRKTLASKGMSAVQRERISYELGLALDASDQPSCAHWRDHVARFGTKRNASALEGRLERCPRE